MAWSIIRVWIISLSLLVHVARIIADIKAVALLTYNKGEETVTKGTPQRHRVLEWFSGVLEKWGRTSCLLKALSPGEMVLRRCWSLMGQWLTAHVWTVKITETSRQGVRNVTKFRLQCELFPLLMSEGNPGEKKQENIGRGLGGGGEVPVSGLGASAISTVRELWRCSPFLNS